MGKLVVPSIFWDVDLLVALAKRYDPITRIVSNFTGDCLFVVSPSLIKEVFGLSKNNTLLEKIDLSQLQSAYKAQALYLRAGPLKEHFVKIGGLCLVTSATLEPLKKKFFNPRAQALYISLCKILGVVETDHVPGYLVMMMAQILQYGLTSIFYFATYLAEQIHHGLIRIAKGELDKPFYWYSILMYICLYKGSAVLGRDMKLVKESYEVVMPIQLWNADITSEALGASYVHFDKFFASKLRGLLV